MSDIPTPTPDIMPATTAPVVVAPVIPAPVVATIKADIVKSEAFLAKVINWLSTHKYTAVLILGGIIGFILGHLI